ncbi:MAG: DUF559 domain-containing protein [Armatimonadetes bacterium]|nr:DUF559 domain-containing protein [Armatimonadota bacterium]
MNTGGWPKNDWNEFTEAGCGETLEEFEFRFLAWSKEHKSQAQQDAEEKIRANVFKQVLSPGPLRRALFKIVEQEDFDYEFIIQEQSPFGYIFGVALDDEITSRGHLEGNPDVREAKEVALRALMYEYLYHAQNDIDFTFSKCQSPIEAILLGALIIVGAKKNLTLRLNSKALRWPRGMIHRSHNSSVAVSIEPQAEVGEHRVDFLLRYQHISTAYPPEAIEQRAPFIGFIAHPELATHEKHRKQLIVECDGHEFHEKTRAQVARDKQRDRYLQKLGYKVFRFSGSEINQDAISCALEVFDGFDVDTGSKEPVSPPSRKERQ